MLNVNVASTKNNNNVGNFYNTPAKISYEHEYIIID